MGPEHLRLLQAEARAGKAKMARILEVPPEGARRGSEIITIFEKPGVFGAPQRYVHREGGPPCSYSVVAPPAPAPEPRAPESMLEKLIREDMEKRMRAGEKDWLDKNALHGTGTTRPPRDSTDDLMDEILNYKGKGSMDYADLLRTLRDLGGPFKFPE